MSNLATIDRSQVSVSLSDNVQDYVLASVSANTTRGYKCDLAHFETWSKDNGLRVSYPIPSHVVANYLSYCAENLKMSTINRRIAALNYAHKLNGSHNIQTDPIVTSLIMGIKRTLSVQVDQHEPLTIEKIRKIVARIDTSTLKGVRDKALLLIGFAGAFRRSELADLTLEDVKRQEQGLCLEVRRSKTDQEGEGDCVPIVYGNDPETCPITALEDWLKRAGIEEGSLFRSISKHGKLGESITGDGIHRVVKERVFNAGYDPQEYGAHSLRAGAATTAANNDASDAEIAKLGRWKPGSKAMYGYIRHRSVFERTAATKLGL